MDFRVSGLLPATFTPMNPDGSLHLEQVGPIVQRLIDDGVSGVYICGSTGEGMSLTTDERKQVAAAYVDAVGRRLTTIVQVGHDSLATARELAIHARKIGADAISAVPPYYFKPRTVRTLVDCLCEITGAAPDLPFFYYHIPELTGVDVSPIEVLEEASERIPTFCGLKFTAASLDLLHAALALDGDRLNILFGRDEMLLSGLAVGVRGAIGSTYNFAAPLFRRMIQAFERGDLAEARRCQLLAVEMVQVIRRFGVMAGLKASMNLVGPDCGPVRLPLVTLDEGQTADLRRRLETIGFFEWAVVPST